MYPAFLILTQVHPQDIHKCRRFSEEQADERGLDLIAKAGYDIEVQSPISYLKDKNITRIFRFISTHPHMDHVTGIKLLHDEIGINNLWISKNKHDQDLSELSDSQKEDWKSPRPARII